MDKNFVGVPGTLQSDANAKGRDFARSGGKAAYATKAESYFSGARRDWVDALPLGAGAAVVELGCGSGNTGAYAMAQGKCSRYCGIEIGEQPAAAAQRVLSEVVIGDVEKVDLPWPLASFDALLMSEVLEHLVDPWHVLRKLGRLLKPGAIVMASSPNVSHYQIVRQLIKGRWDLTDAGAMDRTHLRWFTPQSYARLFQDCGYAVDHVGGLQPLTAKARWLCRLTGWRVEHLFVYQINLCGHFIGDPSKSGLSP